jgi:hypothetical protein
MDDEAIWLGASGVTHQSPCSHCSLAANPPAHRQPLPVVETLHRFLIAA